MHVSLLVAACDEGDQVCKPRRALVLPCRTRWPDVKGTCEKCVMKGSICSRGHLCLPVRCALQRHISRGAAERLCPGWRPGLMLRGAPGACLARPADTVGGQLRPAATQPGHHERRQQRVLVAGRASAAHRPCQAGGQRGAHRAAHRRCAVLPGAHAQRHPGELRHHAGPHGLAVSGAAGATPCAFLRAVV